MVCILACYANTSCLQSVFLLLLLLFWVSKFLLFLLFISHQAAHTTYSFRQLSLLPTFEALTLCSHCAWAMEMDGQRERTHSFVDPWSQWVHNGVYIEGIPTAAGKLSLHVCDDTASSESVNMSLRRTTPLFYLWDSWIRRCSGSYSTLCLFDRTSYFILHKRKL